MTVVFFPSRNYKVCVRCSPLSQFTRSEVEHGDSIVVDKVWPWSSPGESEGSHASCLQLKIFRRFRWTCDECEK